MTGFFICFLQAERTGLEPATSAVTGQHSNQLNYRSKNFSLYASEKIFPVIFRECKDIGFLVFKNKTPKKKSKFLILHLQLLFSQLNLYHFSNYQDAKIREPSVFRIRKAY